MRISCHYLLETESCHVYFMTKQRLDYSRMHVTHFQEGVIWKSHLSLNLFKLNWVNQMILQKTLKKIINHLNKVLSELEITLSSFSFHFLTNKITWLTEHLLLNWLWRKLSTNFESDLKSIVRLQLLIKLKLIVANVIKFLFKSNSTKWYYWIRPFEVIYLHKAAFRTFGGLIFCQKCNVILWSKFKLEFCSRAKKLRLSILFFEST